MNTKRSSWSVSFMAIPLSEFPPLCAGAVSGRETAPDILPKLKISCPEAGAAKKIGAKLAVDRNQRPTQAAACIPYNKHPMAGKKNRSLWPLIVIGTAFSLLGLAAMLIAGWQIVSHLRAQHWEMQSAVLESLQTRDSSRSGSSLSARTSRVEGRYRYQFAGREYVGERLSFSIVRSNGFDDWDEQLRETLGAEGGAINILVNPDNPAESVALADIRWAEFGAILLFAAGMGGGGCLLLSIALTDGRRPRLLAKTPPVIVVRGRTVILMWLLAPIFGTLAWLLWRDGHGIWAGVAAVQLLLAANASVAYLRQQLR